MTIGWIRLKASQKCSWRFKHTFGLVSAYGVPIWYTICSSLRFLSKTYELIRHGVSAMCLTVTRLSFIIRWIPSTWASVKSLTPYNKQHTSSWKNSRKNCHQQSRISLVFIHFLWSFVITPLYSFLVKCVIFIKMTLRCLKF